MNTEHNRFTLRELGLDGLHHIYHEHLSHAFPRMERKPLSAMEKLMAAGRYEALGLYDGEELAAYALLWDDPEGGYVLLDYLAVCRDKPRGHGYGTAALRLLLDRCRDRRGLLVEAEAQEEGVPPEENALRARRLSFYERSGFRRLDYQTRIFGVQYAMLVWPEEDAAEPERLQDAHRGLYRSQLPNPLFRRVIHIPADEH